MKLTFHGAVRTVTGSQHLLSVNGVNILLDCGFYQGKRSLSYERNQQFPFNPSEIDVLILSHAHIDHSGNIPNLVKQGFRRDIVCTYATRDLCTIMLRDSAHIQESDIVYVNKKRARKGEPPVEPIYTMEDAEACLEQFVGLGYERPFRVAPGVSVTFYDAGHILGSAIVALDIEDEEQKRDVRLVFSGDVGRPNRPILRDPTFLKEADLLLIESTYGDREHKETTEANGLLAQLINDTWKRGGKVVVPAFAIGRTQELIYRLHQLMENGEIPQQLPIYVDSPLAIDATAIYRMHPEAYDAETAALLWGDNPRDPFGFGMMRYTRSAEQSKSLNDLKEPAVIISASGMAETGRILHHLKNNMGDERNTILIVGWQAPETVGRRLVERMPLIRIFGEEHELKAQVAVLNGLSAHADRRELLEWVGAFNRRPRHTFIVHGEEPVSLAFADSLRQEQGLEQVVVPELHQSFEV